MAADDQAESCSSSYSSYTSSYSSTSRGRSRSPVRSPVAPAAARPRPSRWGEAAPVPLAPPTGAAEGGRQYRPRLSSSPPRGGGGGGRPFGGPSGTAAFELPPEELPITGMCYRAAVVSVRDFGAFVKIPGYAKQGLVHISQLAQHRVDASELRAFVREGEEVWVKVLAVEGTGATVRVACSMKVVDQEDGRDLDPDDEEGQARRSAAAGSAERGGAGLGASGSGGRRGGGARSMDPPALYSIHRGTVKSQMPFGVFVELEGYAKQGLCHISQVSDGRVDASELESLCPVGSSVWAKVEKVDALSGKYGLSLKNVDQLTGVDLDPEHAAADGGGGLGPRAGGFGGGAEPGSLVRKGGAGPALDWGHMAADIYKPPPGQAHEYDFVVDEEDALLPSAPPGGLRGGGTGERTLADVWRDGPDRQQEEQEAQQEQVRRSAVANGAMLGVGLESVARAEALIAQAMGVGTGGKRGREYEAEEGARRGGHAEGDEESGRRGGKKEKRSKRGKADKADKHKRSSKERSRAKAKERHRERSSGKGKSRDKERKRDDKGKERKGARKSDKHRR